ncbi:ABC transporter ATP-binding protein [Sporosarcina sp. D27]|uniref:ABC transporter ATP-binding protein n=1 Tax=Sporosarcina sp. D27 TaxID=1382305 RepID=UPI000471314C|nr:ABC transporter ATP-binding protein [Sporosarcina sp. D27]
MTTIIDCLGVGKSFKGKVAVRDLSFQIEKGEVVALLGPNGAGKSTTIQMLLGLLEPSTGRITISGQNSKSKAVRERIGVMLQEVRLLDTVTVKEILQLVRGYYHRPLSMEQLSKLTGLDETSLNMRTEKLSGGQKQRVSFALALAGNPDILFLDEPTTGMDATARKTFWKSIRELAERGTTIIFTTHYLEEVEYAATRVLMINHGELIEDESPDMMKKKLVIQRISFLTDEVYRPETFQGLSVSDIRLDGKKVTILTGDADHLLKVLYELDLEISEVTVSRGTLEEAYSQLTDSREVS